VRRLTFVLAAVASLAIATPAASAQAEPLAVTSTVPAEGTTYAPLTTPGGGGFRFELKSPTTKITGMYVEVATQNSPLGQDGTLADDFRVDFFSLFESDAYPGTYVGASNHVPNGGWWTSRPGTYYWQARATYIDYSTSPSQLKTVISPIYTLTIAAPPPPAPPAQPPPSSDGDDSNGYYFEGISEAKRVLRSVLRKAYGSRFSRRRAYRASCGLNGGQEKATCSVSWKHRSWRYKGTARMTAVDDGAVRYSLNIRKQRTR
jgi:hypothetical protein